MIPLKHKTKLRPMPVQLVEQQDFPSCSQRGCGFQTLDLARPVFRWGLWLVVGMTVVGFGATHVNCPLAAEQSPTVLPSQSLQEPVAKELQPKPTVANQAQQQPDPQHQDPPAPARPDQAQRAPTQREPAKQTQAEPNGSQPAPLRGNPIPQPASARSDPSSAQDAGRDKPGSAWIRILRDASGEPLALQTAIVRYQTQSASGSHRQADLPGNLTVDLIGAIHVGDRAYYDRLNRRFREYEALLFELVAPEGTVVPQGSGTSNAHPIGAMQNGLKGILDLEHQLERIDYTRANLIHADMSPGQLAKSMRQRGESFLQMYFRLVGAEMARQSQQQSQGKFAELNIFKALFASDRTRQLKIALAQEFENVETLMTGFNGPDGSSLITERNKVAIQVLAEQIQKGRQHLGIFYGAGHLPDMHKRLQDKFHLIPVKVLWIDAWDLRTGS